MYETNIYMMLWMKSYNLENINTFVILIFKILENDQR